MFPFILIGRFRKLTPKERIKGAKIGVIIGCIGLVIAVKTMVSPFSFLTDERNLIIPVLIVLIIFNAWYLWRFKK